MAARLSALDKRAARRLLDLGQWVDAAQGHVLTRQGEAVEHLTFVADGLVEIGVDGRVVALCGQGNFVGEMSLFGDPPASATATLARNARLWQIRSRTVRALQKTSPKLASALEAGIGQDMRAKLLASNSALHGAVPR